MSWTLEVIKSWRERAEEVRREAQGLVVPKERSKIADS
jgi:hypothetical protein